MCASVDLYCWISIAFPPAYRWKLFKTLSIFCLNNFLNLFLHSLSHPLVCLCHSPTWVPALPSSVRPKLCWRLSQTFPLLEIMIPSLLLHIFKMLIVASACLQLKRERWNEQRWLFPAGSVCKIKNKMNSPFLTCKMHSLPLTFNGGWRSERSELSGSKWMCFSSQIVGIWRCQEILSTFIWEE